MSVPTAERLAAVRGDGKLRALAVVAGVFVAVGLGAVHWVGFLVGGAVAGLGQRDLPRGVVSGLLVGALSWVAFAALLAVNGTLEPALGMGSIVYLSVAIPLVAGGLGGLLRGVV